MNTLPVVSIFTFHFLHVLNGTSPDAEKILFEVKVKFNVQYIYVQMHQNPAIAVHRFKGWGSAGEMKFFPFDVWGNRAWIR